MKALAEKARSGKLKPHEFQGGSFTQVFMQYLSNVIKCIQKYITN